ncbi:hypothetical protein MTP99_000348 [Tenebrio molitor]|nr:hypothetical protein MTP99_000348 [Tenebrio molitor]
MGWFCGVKLCENSEISPIYFSRRVEKRRHFVSVAEEWCVWLCAARSCPPAEICKFRTVETAGSRLGGPCPRLVARIVPVFAEKSCKGIDRLDRQSPLHELLLNTLPRVERTLRKMAARAAPQWLAVKLHQFPKSANGLVISVDLTRGMGANFPLLARTWRHRKRALSGCSSNGKVKAIVSDKKDSYQFLVISGQPEHLRKMVIASEDIVTTFRNFIDWLKQKVENVPRPEGNL